MKKTRIKFPENINLFSFGKMCAWSLCLLLANVPLKTTGQIDTLEYPPGHPSNITVSAVDQLKSFPVPRYKPGHTLLPNFNIVDPLYMGGYKQPGVSDQTAVQNVCNITRELAANFNYMVNVTWFNTYYNDSLVNIANSHPQWKVCLMTLRAQVGTKMWYQGFPADHYLQNAAGQPLDWNGNVTVGDKVWRPTAPPADYSPDGTTVRGFLNLSLANLTRPVDLVTENGEVYPVLETAALMNDPVVAAAKAASGLDWQYFFAGKVAQNEIAYRSQFMTHPRLTNAIYSLYNTEGFPAYNFEWSNVRTANTQINGHYYPTVEFYPRWPSNWKDWTSAWHGLKWVSRGRYFEKLVNDELFSPYVAAGWDANPETDIRPAQWLGLMKIMGMWGTEFYYTGYFNEGSNYDPPNPPPHDPKGYAWQCVIPSYAQGIVSRVEDFMRSGTVLNGDVVDVGNPVIASPGYQFNTGITNYFVCGRQKTGTSKYVLMGTIQNGSNVLGSAPLSDDATITFLGQTLKFKIRRQGSTYIYDLTNASAPIFYQLDGWHESSHPLRWSKDFNIEAELYDNTSTTYNLKTTVPAGTPARDFRTFTTFITFPDAQTSFTPIEYVFTPRGLTTATHYLWVKMRSRVNGFTTGVTVSVDNANTKTIGCVSDTIWKWYRIDATSQNPISFANLSLASHTLRITPTNSKIEIDQIVLSPSSTLSLSPAGPTCSVNCTATATANGPLAFCPGGSVVLTASSGASYLWTPGNQTTQSITVSSTGNYSVKVTQSNGCSATSTPLTVSLGSAASATITPNGPLTFNMGGSVTLTANAGSSYLWTPGNQTTQAITVGQAGTYSVRVTNASGCSALSAPVTVVVNGGSQGVASITANGPTSFCTGSSVVLTASAGMSYVWSTNATTQSITASTAGAYQVTVTFTSSISTSTPVNVFVNPCTCPIPTGLHESPVTANNATLIWNAGTGVDSLKIKLFEPISGNTYFATVAGNSTFINVSVSPSHKYYWRVKSKCGTGWSLWSYNETFTTPAFREAGGIGMANIEPVTEMTLVENYREEGELISAAERSMYIFPNPATTTASVIYKGLTDGTITLRLMDFTGKEVMNETRPLTEGDNQYELDLRNLPTGVYIVIINDGGIMNSKKIVVN